MAKVKATAKVAPKTKKAAKKVAKAKTEEQAFVDDYVATAAECAALKGHPAFLRMAEMEDQLKERGESEPAEAKVVLRGTGNRRIELGPKANARTVTDAKKALKLLKDALGDRVWGVIKPQLGLLDKYLTEEEVETVVEEDRSGPRRKTVIGS